MVDIVTEKRCDTCKEIKPLMQFSRCKMSLDGYTSYCRSCKREYDKRYKQEIKSGVRQKVKRKKVLAKNYRLAIVSLLGGKCARCGYEDIRALQIDHINGNGHQERKQMSQNKLYEKIYMELQQVELHRTINYQLLCANCNWIKRYENKETGNQHTHGRDKNTK